MTSLTLGDLLSEDHIVLLPGGGSSRQVIESLVGRLARDGLVDPEYAKDVWSREQEYPTGLPTSPLPSALPHGESNAIHESSAAMAILSKPVDFGQMGTDGSTVVAARIVVLLAIREREKQVKVIQQVAQFLQNQELLSQLSQASSPSNAYAITREFL